MLRRINLLCFLFAFSGNVLADNTSRIVTYDVPQKALYTYHNDDFTVRVRVPGGEWQDLYEYKVKVDLDKPRDASMVYFDMEGPIEVAVKKNNGDVARVEVRPSSAGIKPRLHESTARFTLEHPRKISIEFDGNRLHNLHLFANPIEKERPNPNDPNVIWFGPGVHTPPEDSQGTFQIPSNKTVYIAGGALVQGNIAVHNAENVKIIGHGIIDNPGRGFEITKSNNVLIDGPIVINPKHYTVFCGQSTNLTIRNIKTFSASPWSDGIDMMSCSEVLIDDVFLRTSDDSIAVYGHRWDYYGDARNISVINSTLWADIAHPIHIGIHGNAKNPEVIEHLIFRNIDILEHDEDDRNYQGAMAISAGDDNLVRNVLFEDIRIDRIEEGMLFNVRVVYNEKYSHSPGRGAEDITFRNISFKGGDINRSVIEGHSKDRAVRKLVIENVTVAGRPIKYEDIDINEFVQDVKVSP